MRKLAIAALAAVVGCGTAQAAVVTRSYIVTNIFTSGPFASVTQTFTATFDPTVNATGIAVSNYTVDNNSPVFNQPVLLEVDHYFGYADILLYAPTYLGTSVDPGHPDFYTQFYADTNTGIPNDQGGDLLYSLGTGQSGIHDSTSYRSALLSAAPEPAAWMTMAAGFGVIGAALRRRRSASPLPA